MDNGKMDEKVEFCTDIYGYNCENLVIPTLKTLS